MNERIIELAEQASHQSPDGYAVTIPYSKDFAKKFAELIVRECAELCEGEAIFAGSNGRKDASASNCSTIIRKHFGVEE
jgi:hypothetical protein